MYASHNIWYHLGDSLPEWTGLILDKCEYDEHGPQLFSLREEDAMFKAYVHPSDVVLLSIRPTVPPANPENPRLLSAELCDWSAYYSWRGLPLSSPVAFILHWPLSVYFVLQRLLPRLGKSPIFHTVYASSGSEPTRRILQSKTLHIHLIGVEMELDMLPTFKVRRCFQLPTYLFRNLIILYQRTLTKWYLPWLDQTSPHMQAPEPGCFHPEWQSM